MSIRVGLSVTDALLVPKPADRRLLLDSAAEAGIDHITVGDHISFHGGTGFDGMVSATSVLSAHDTLSVIIGVYLLGLRHPMLAARQIATLSQIAPGRLVLGAGVGGEDRSEISNSGVDPSTRGRRLDEHRVPQAEQIHNPPRIARGTELRHGNCARTDTKLAVDTRRGWCRRSADAEHPRFTIRAAHACEIGGAFG